MDRHGFSHEALSTAAPAVAFAHLKQLWADGSRAEALERMRVFVRDPTTAADSKLAAKSWLKLGEWQRAMLETHAPLVENKISLILTSLQRATDLNPQSYNMYACQCTYCHLHEMHICKSM